MQRAETGLWHGTAVLLAIALTSCISVVAPPPLNESEPMTTQPSKRVPLEAEGKIAIFLSTEVASEHSSLSARLVLFDPIYVEPISSADAAVRSFREGFRSVRDGEQLVVADENLRRACFNAATKWIDASGLVVIVPKLETPGCVAAVEQQGISYVIAIGGSHTRRFSNDYYYHEFRLLARAFDARNAELVCEEVEVRTTKSELGFLPFVLIPVGSVVDEQAFWARVAHDAGAKIGACLMKP